MISAKQKKILFGLVGIVLALAPALGCKLFIDYLDQQEKDRTDKLIRESWASEGWRD